MLKKKIGVFQISVYVVSKLQSEYTRLKENSLEGIVMKFLKLHIVANNHFNGDGNGQTITR